MNKKRKMDKGITLVALIITIIVLLILAVVTILEVTGDGIITKAKEAKKEYEKSQDDEEKRLLDYKYEIANAQETFTGSYEQDILDKKYGLKIGDYVNYDEGTLIAITVKTTESGYLEKNFLPTNNLNWRVLGINSNGEIELISDNPTDKALTLNGQVGCQNAETTLDTLCNNLYGKGIYASGARSLDVDDIDKLSNFDKSNYGKGKLWAYGNEVTYSWQETLYPYYSATNGVKGSLNSSHDTFNWFDEKSNSWKSSTKSTTTSAMEKITTLKSDYYYYNIANNITTDDGFTEEEATQISDMITKGTGTSYLGTQWLASRCIGCWASNVHFYVRTVNGGDVKSDDLYDSCGKAGNGSYYVRPVVSLKSNIQIDTSDTTKDGKTAATAYEIKKT